MSQLSPPSSEVTSSSTVSNTAPTPAPTQALTRRRLFLILCLVATLLIMFFLLATLFGNYLSSDVTIDTSQTAIHHHLILQTTPRAMGNISEDEPTFHYRDLIYNSSCELVMIAALAYFFFIPLFIWSFPQLVRFVLFPGITTDKELRLPSGRYHGVDEFYLPFTCPTTGERIRLGVWHIPPQDDLKLLDRAGQGFGPDKRLLILMAHGNAGDRTAARPQYRMLTTKLGCHVVAFDYRGYGDSSNVCPTADGLAEDTRAVYNWILQRGVAPNRVLFWGHSLGGAICLRALARLPPRLTPLGVILESTFSSLRDEIAAFPFTRPFRCLPYFKCCFLEPITSNDDLNFDSLAALPTVHCPLLILHAVDDNVIPFELGEKLYESARQLQPPSVAAKTKLVDFPARYHCKHKGIALRPELAAIISRFVLEVVKK